MECPECAKHALYTRVTPPPGRDKRKKWDKWYVLVVQRRKKKKSCNSCTLPSTFSTTYVGILKLYLSVVLCCRRESWAWCVGHNALYHAQPECAAHTVA